MPRLTKSLPKYRKHRASGQAIVTLSGVDHYLGPHGTKASTLEYDRLISEWLAAGRRLPATSDNHEAITVVEVCAAYLKHAKGYYIKNGKPTYEIQQITRAVRIVRELYGRQFAIEFGPLALKACQLKMIDNGEWGRDYINAQIRRIRKMFKWAAGAELIPGSIVQNLNAVEGLKKGRTKAKESTPVLPVDEVTVDATLPHLSPVVADMVRFQRLTGARPGEVCSMRPIDLDRDGDVWRYVPSAHKTEHHDRQRTIYIGPQAQGILRPYLLRGEADHCFSPADSERQRRAEQHASRRTPLSSGNRPGTNRKRSPKRAPKDHYTKDSYNRAITRAVAKANKDRTAEGVEPIESWSPNRLRHSKATEVRKLFGLEGAQVALGHASADVTQVYAERDAELAERVALATG